jgi:hypothetical protein
MSSLVSRIFGAIPIFKLQSPIKAKHQARAKFTLSSLKHILAMFGLSKKSKAQAATNIQRAEASKREKLRFLANTPFGSGKAVQKARNEEWKTCSFNYVPTYPLYSPLELEGGSGSGGRGVWGQI